MVNLPAEFVAETRRIMGEERFARFLGAFDEDAPVSIRVNTKRYHHCQSGQVPWCPEGYYLEDRPQFTFDPLLHAGCYYVQEASSMFVTHVLRSVYREQLTAESKLVALDACAAPGGKSTALRQVLPDDCVLISNEPMGTRAQILLENVTKWGGPHHIVTNNYPRDFRKAKLKFDMILCDVPCSGEGMFRKDPGAIKEWSPQNVEKCWQLQREIVTDAWECLQPGGLFIYSTCTYNTKENEENIRWILDNFDAEVLNVPTDPAWGITGSLLEGFNAPVYRFIPGITRGEGLFICALRKSSRKNEGERTKVITPADICKNKNLKVLSPAYFLLSPSSSVLPTEIDVDYPTALQYLRGEALVLPAETPRGIVTITYQGQPLGPAKNIGNRANNLYPKSWRIKSTHLPDQAPDVLRQCNNGTM